jgi:hypothetical protein
VRAQAKLVLSAADIDTRYAEFEKLRALAPQHPLVSLLGPTLASDYELSSSFRQAAARSAPALVEPDDAAPSSTAP